MTLFPGLPSNGRPGLLCKEELPQENKMDEVDKQLHPVKDLLDRKRFTAVKATHMSGGAVVLHDGERRAKGPFERVLQVIQEASDRDSMWTALEAAGLLWPHEEDAV